MNVGEKLRHLRLSMKKTLKQQGEIFNVTANSVYRWEHNLAVPRMPVLKKIADHYNVPMEWFFHENTSSNSANLEFSSQAIAGSIEQQLISTFSKLSDGSKYKVLGYVERMCIEEYMPDGQ